MPTSRADLLQLVELIQPKPERPNLVENINDALANPERTVRDYLFTPTIRGYFERVFRDLKEQRGGGYWVEAEYGGGKTHFLSSLLCLLTADGGGIPIWNSVADADLRTVCEPAGINRRLLGAQLSLMGTTAVLGSTQQSLVALIDNAIIGALQVKGIADPGVSASTEVIDAFGSLDPAIRDAVEGAFRTETGMTVAEYRNERNDLDAANAILAAARAKGITLDRSIEVQSHYRHVLQRLETCGFDGLLIVIDEYYSRQGVLSPAQALEDGSILET